MAECSAERQVGRSDVARRGGASRRNFGGRRAFGNHYDFDGCFGAGGCSGLGGESVGFVYHCVDDAVGFGDGAGNARGGWNEDTLGDNFWGVGFGGMCLGGEVGSRDTLASQNVHVGGADIGVVDHGVWTDGECPADLASFGAKGLP